MEARVEEMFGIIARDIRRSGYEELLAAGVVLTGGTSDLRGIREVASRQLQMPVRIGVPHRLHGVVEAVSNPAYATAVGLLLWGIKAAADKDDLPLIERPRTILQIIRSMIKRLMP